MPYIDDSYEGDRDHIDDAMSEFREQNYSDPINIRELARIIKNVPSGKAKGAFNYFVSRLWLQTFFPEGKLGYTSLSDALGVFPDMEDEMRRRLMHLYEDECIKKNGDLPEFKEILNER